MTDSTGGENRDAVLKKLEQADAEDAEIEKKAREVLVTVRHQRDLNKAFSEIVEIIPNDSYFSNKDWRDLNSAFDNRLVQARSMNSQLDTVRLYTTSLYGSTAVSTSVISNMTTNPVFTNAQPGVPDWYNERFAPRVTRLNEVMQQGLVREQVEQLLKARQLDMDKGEIKSPLMRLQEAYTALNQANTELASASSILVPLRDCIEAIASMLLSRRPTQEKTGGLQKQIESIGRQCKYGHVQDADFAVLGGRAAHLQNLYSSFKDKRILREDVLVHFNAGVALIRSFLHAIDPDKLK